MKTMTGTALVLSCRWSRGYNVLIILYKIRIKKKCGIKTDTVRLIILKLWYRGELIHP
jgi:hypothetical protein